MNIRKNFPILFLLFFIQPSFATDLGNKSATMYAPFLEWSLNNSSFPGNPFDVIAKVTFRHLDSSKTHTTEMFYAGDNVWKFRFTGTSTGSWNFVTTSPDPELNGHTGTVSVDSNPNATGFLTKSGNKFAIQSGNNASLKPFRLNVFMTDYQGDRNNIPISAFTTNTISKTRTYARAAKSNGMSAIFVSLLHNTFKLGALTYNEHSNINPDTEAFEVIEKFITTAHSEGVHVYFWIWGDEERKMTPLGLPGGMNGTVDKRLQRYIAARLGPLPGWSMGLGFDLKEWTNASGRNAWANYLHDHMGWDHLLSARGYKLPSGNNINGYSSSGLGSSILDTLSLGGPHTYTEALEDIQSDINRPSLYEERHIYKRDRYYGVGWKNTTSMDGTRRLIWRSTMVGGTGGWYGFFREDPVFGNDKGYSNPEQLLTAANFWDKNERFLLSMKPTNNLSSNSVVLKSSDNKNYVFYAEDASSVNLNLSDMSNTQNAIAVDTKKAYNEVNIGNLNPSITSWTAPYASDWAIAVGSFNSSNTPPIADTIAPSNPTSLIAR